MESGNAFSLAKVLLWVLLIFMRFGANAAKLYRTFLTLNAT
jgi:hypothetical protein